jgi:DNA repair exonuclease SbcCD nuclease subunit
MQIAVLGDTHFGMRGDNLAFHNYYKMFYQNVFFPYLRKHNIKTVIQTGDLFDRRKFVNFNTLHLAKSYFFNEFQVNDIQLITYIGNHDVYFKNTLEINSIKLLLTGASGIQIIDKPTTMFFDPIPIDIIPWVCEDNEKNIREFIDKSKSQICFGHFEISGFEMDRGNICNDGIDRNTLSKYETVYTGHFHHKSTDGHIFYVGSPGEMTWADYDDSRGFHIFDTETRELEFIENPYRMFHKIVYDDSTETLESVTTRDFSKYTNTMVKLVVIKKDNPILFDTFMDALYKVQPLDLTIVEDFTDYTELADSDVIDQADSTTVILDKYVDSVDLNVDKPKLKNILREIYIEAQNLEV